jgi:hypothetical protein
MNTPDLTIKPFRTGKSNLFYQIGESYFVQSPCVFTKNKLLRINEVYDLLDLLDDGKFHLKHIKLLNVYLKGYVFYIYGIDFDNGELITRHSRLGFRDTNSKWMIEELFYFASLSDKKAIQAYCEQNKSEISQNKSDELLDFDF